MSASSRQHAQQARQEFFSAAPAYRTGERLEEIVARHIELAKGEQVHHMMKEGWELPDTGGRQ